MSQTTQFWWNDKCSLYGTGILPIFPTITSSYEPDSLKWRLVWKLVPPVPKDDHFPITKTQPMLGQNQGARSCQKSIFCWSCWAAVLQSDCRSPPPQQRIQRKQSTREEMGQEGRSLDASDFLRHHSDAIQMPFRCHSDAIRAKTLSQRPAMSSHA